MGEILQTSGVGEERGDRDEPVVSVGAGRRASWAQRSRGFCVLKVREILSSVWGPGHLGYLWAIQVETAPLWRDGLAFCRRFPLGMLRVARL